MSSLNDTSLHDSSEPFTDPPFYGGLLEDELPWRKRYNYLLSKGYMLRPRYKPDWTPSWIGTSKHPMHCEDGIPSENVSRLLLVATLAELSFVGRIGLGRDQIGQRLQSCS